MKVNEFIRQAAREGWTALPRNGGHWQLEHPLAAEPVIFSASPSDYRWLENTLARMR
jgi:predicted RNA binding protein YcfA (HicA-like mRNA interferase family)